jgi:hypothetical protein
VARWNEKGRKGVWLEVLDVGPFMGSVRWRVAVVIFVFGLGITCQVVACDHVGRSGISTKNLRG